MWGLQPYNCLFNITQRTSKDMGYLRGKHYSKRDICSENKKSPTPRVGGVGEKERYRDFSVLEVCSRQRT